MGGERTPQEILDFEASFLAYLLDTCRVEVDGTVVETRQQVGSSKGLSIHIFSNEHPPPHFHVKRDNLDASFALDDGRHLKGDVSSRDRKIIAYYFRLNRDHLIEVWNNTRPTDCPVGVYEP